MQQRKKGVILSYINLALSVVLGLFYTNILLGALGKNEHGLYSLAASLISYMSLLDLGFGNALIRYNSRTRALGKDDSSLNGTFLLLYTAVAALSVIVGVIMCLNIGSFFKSSFTPEEIYKARIIFIILLINVCVSFPVSVFTSLIKAYERFTFSKVITILTNFLSKILTIVVLYLGFKTSIAVAAVTASVNILFGLCSVIYCFTRMKVKLSFERIEKSYLKEISIFSFWIFINILVDQLYASTDSIILARVCGTAAVSVYTVGVTIKNYFQEMSVAVSGVFLPHISQLAVLENRIGEISDLFNKVSRIQYLLLSFAMIGFIEFGREFIFLWVGSDFSDAYVIALLIMVPSIIPLSQNIGITVLQATNRHKFRSAVYLAIAVLNVAISIPLAMRYEGIGAAAGTAMSCILGQILVMNWFYSKKVGLSISSYWKNIIIITLKIIPMAAVGILMNYFVSSMSWVTLIVKAIVFSLLYVVYSWFVMLNDYEKSIVKGAYNKIKRRD